MRADGGVDAAAGALGVEDEGVQRLAHAVEALEFVIVGPRPMSRAMWRTAATVWALWVANWG